MPTSTLNLLTRWILLAMVLCAPLCVHAQDWEAIQGLTPQHYISYHTSQPITIDGKLDDAAWQDAAWTDLFVDIEGPRKPQPRYDTRVKMTWDSTYLYVAAEMEESHVWGTLTERNAIIFHDNDFEIFIDPDGDNHNYYEFEVNALNTIWELTLSMPYRDGRDVATHGTNLPGLRSAVHVEGTLNASHDTDVGWSVEVALPWDGLATYSPSPVPPVHGEQWRVNFSRVQWQHRLVGGAYEKLPETPENNWVWSPQGLIAMHMPERWGYVQFSTLSPGTDTFRPDPTRAAREQLMMVYHRQKAYNQQHGQWATSLDTLLLPEERSAHSSELRLAMKLTQDGFEAVATVTLPDDSILRVHTNHTSRIWRTSQ